MDSRSLCAQSADLPLQTVQSLVLSPDRFEENLNRRVRTAKIAIVCLAVVAAIFSAAALTTFFVCGAHLIVFYFGGTAFITGLIGLALFIQRERKKEHLRESVAHLDPLLRSLVLNLPQSHRGDLGVYLTTNESRLERTQAILDQTPLQENACHIGTAGWHNFDIMVQRHSSFGLICDYNKNNKTFMEQTLHVLVGASDRMEFIREMKEYIRSVEQENLYAIGRNRFGFSPEQLIEEQLRTPGSWLSTEEGFQYIKTLANQGKIVPLIIDFTANNQLQQIHNELSAGGILVDTVYLSNVQNFIPTQERHLFVEALESLVRPDSLVIHCPQVSAQESASLSVRHRNCLKQHVNVGQELIDRPEKYFTRLPEGEEDIHSLY